VVAEVAAEDHFLRVMAAEKVHRSMAMVESAGQRWSRSEVEVSDGH
jgi:hypothetical protein